MSVELTVAGIALAPIILAIVELAKTAGMKIDYAPWLTGVLSVLGYILVLTFQTYPQYESYIVSGLTMLVIFLTTTGLYDRAYKPASKALNR